MFKKNPEFINTALSFEAKSTPFPPSFLTKPLNPNVWWKALSSADFPAGFVQIMSDLQRACASSASIEHIFSNFSFIHSKLRNKLGVEKTAKLVMRYRMLRGPIELDY